MKIRQLTTKQIIQLKDTYITPRPTKSNAVVAKGKKLVDITVYTFRGSLLQ